MSTKTKKETPKTDSDPKESNPLKKTEQSLTVSSELFQKIEQKVLALKQNENLSETKQSFVYKAIKNYVEELEKQVSDETIFSRPVELKKIRIMLDQKLLERIDQILLNQKKKKGYASKKDLFVKAIEKFMNKK